MKPYQNILAENSEEKILNNSLVALKSE